MHLIHSDLYWSLRLYPDPKGDATRESSQLSNFFLFVFFALRKKAGQPVYKMLTEIHSNLENFYAQSSR